MEDLSAKLQADPMARYVPTLSELVEICDAFEIGSLITIDGELGGLFNVNLKITTTTGPYVVRVHSGLSRYDHMAAEAVLLKKLQACGIPVLAPLDSKSKEHFLVLHTRFVQLTPFIQGIPFSCSVGQVYQCGKMLRKFHDALLEENEIPVPEWSNYPSHAILQEGMAKMRTEQARLHERSLIEEVERLYRLVMDEWTPREEELIKTVIHADWHPWNVLFDETEQVQYVLDFDFLQKGERIHDLAYFLWAVRESEKFEALGQRFIKGYGPLSPVEVDMLPIAMARVCLFFLCTASFVADPVQELKQQMNRQKPYLAWLLSSEGKACIKKLFVG